MLDLLAKHEEIVKEYLVLTFNNPSKKEGIIDAPLYKDANSGFVKIGTIESGAKEAKTIYKVLDSNKEYSLIKASLITGRTHQLRVHFASIGCPIVGDEKYGDFKKNKIFEKDFDYRTQFLIAYSLTFKNVPGELSYLSNRVFKATISEKELSILKKLNLKILVSLSCTMCPGLVMAAQRIAAENANITAEVYDINHFAELKTRYNIMSVPCMVINDNDVLFGKKTIAELVEILSKY